MTDGEFDDLRLFLKRRSGLALTPEKRYLVESRLTPLCARFGHADLGALILALTRGRAGDAEMAVVEAMTTNETLFFRDKLPFDLFRDVLLPQALASPAAGRPLRIWCAAASSGQEPYSLAMLLREAGPRLAGREVEILATDLSAEVLERARAGLYTQFEVQRGLPIQMLLRHFTQSSGGRWQISSAIREMVDFKRLNLIEPFEHLGGFDIIYCRNVLIYFDAPTKADLLARLAAALNPDGAIVLGAAETVIGLSDRLVPHPQHRGLYVARRAADAPRLRLAAKQASAGCHTDRGSRSSPRKSV